MTYFKGDNGTKKLLIGSAASVAAGVSRHCFGICPNKEEGGRGPTFPLRPGVPANDPGTPLGCDQAFTVDKGKEVSVLITGAGSYIGTSFEGYASFYYPNISTHTLDMRDDKWKEDKVWDGEVDTVFHVAGIAHSDISTPTPEMAEDYYKVNTDLAIETAKKAKAAGVKQFIFMSSMIVYGDCASTGGKVDRHTSPHPQNFYGDSKWQADKGVRALASPGPSDPPAPSGGQGIHSSKGSKGSGAEGGAPGFAIAALRPPMVYGKRSKGNYPALSRIAKMAPFFPEVSNCRSMLYIENLCEFVCQLTMARAGGVFFPQNGEYGNMGSLVKAIGAVAQKPVHTSKLLTPAVWLAQHAPVRKVRELAQKAFGSSYYDMALSKYQGIDYQKVGLGESVRRTEGQGGGN